MRVNKPAGAFSATDFFVPGAEKNNVAFKTQATPLE